MSTDLPQRRELLQVSPGLVISREVDPGVHADPQKRGGYLRMRPGKAPEIVLDGLADAEEQEEAKRRCLRLLQAQRSSERSKDQPVPIAQNSAGSQPHRLLGQTLVKRGLISAADLRAVLERQAALPADRPVRRLGSLLVEEGRLQMRQLSDILGELRGLRAASCATPRVDPSLRDIFPWSVLVRLQAVPLSLVGKTVGVAMVDPHNAEHVSELQSLTNLNIEPMQAPQGYLCQLLVGMNSGTSTPTPQAPQTPQTPQTPQGVRTPSPTPKTRPSPPQLQAPAQVSPANGLDSISAQSGSLAGAGVHLSVRRQRPSPAPRPIGDALPLNDASQASATVSELVEVPLGAPKPKQSPSWFVVSLVGFLCLLFGLGGGYFLGISTR